MKRFFRNILRSIRRWWFRRDCDRGNHDYFDDYYGHQCRNCDSFFAFGNAPWDYDPDVEARIEREEYYATHYTCEICGGEVGDGWSTCVCDMEVEA